MAQPLDRAHQAKARSDFKRLIVWSFAAGIVMTIVALSALSMDEGTMSGPMIVATIVGVFVSVLLGAGLMALGFLSSASGHDDDAADFRDRNEPPRN